MLDDLARRLYARLGYRYKLIYIAMQVPTSIVAAAGVTAVIASFYDPTAAELWTVMIAVAVLTTIAVLYAILRSRDDLLRLNTWRETADPSPELSHEAWCAATTFPTRSYRRDSAFVNAFVLVPMLPLLIEVLDASWAVAPAMLAAGVFTAAWVTSITYSMSELLMRPLIEDIASTLPEDFAFEKGGLPVRKRIIIGLPVFTATCAFMVAAIVTDTSGDDVFVLSVAASLALGVAMSAELAILLSQSITDPISRLRKALARVAEGDLTARVPVVTADELGEVSYAFNTMAAGLEERERMRTVFGTYLDRAVAELVLDGSFPREGVEIDVSILFCDVRGFTSFAERAGAPEVVATLNDLFETIVPIVERCGGHVDKFMGDGLLAIFGAPEAYADHADRAVAAALDMVAAVNEGDSPLQLAAGVNTGRVVAGSIGGAGRLNFSVIGDAVNVAARTESATRDTGDDVLITSATLQAMQRPLRFVSRGVVPLKGREEALELLAPERQGSSVVA